MFIKEFNNLFNQVLHHQSNTRHEIDRMNQEHKKLKKEFDDSWNEREEEFENYSK